MEYRREPIKDYEEYEVDTLGNVYAKAGYELQFTTNHKGYSIVNFTYRQKKRKGFAIHTLVARQFLPSPGPLQTQVNHINGIKTDNRVENLEWVSPKENVQHAIAMGLICPGESARKSIRGYDKRTHELKYEFNSLAEAGRYFNPKRYRSAQTNIWRVLDGRAKSYKDCTWEYTQ